MVKYPLELKGENMRFKIYRDGDAMMGCIPRLRKVIVELYKGSVMLDRQRIFGGPFLRLRLRITKAIMTRRGQVYVDASGDA